VRGSGELDAKREFTQKTNAASREGIMIRTKLTERYGIELPFVSAGMGFIALPPLAAAVSNAGGLGSSPPARPRLRSYAS